MYNTHTLFIFGPRGEETIFFIEKERPVSHQHAIEIEPHKRRGHLFVSLPCFCPTNYTVPTPLSVFSFVCSPSLNAVHGSLFSGPVLSF